MASQSNVSSQPHSGQNESTTSSSGHKIPKNSETNESSHHGDERKYPDFSELPDVIWMSIFSMLRLGERYSVSRASARLCRLLAVPSLWRTVTVKLESHRPSAASATGGVSRLHPHHHAFVQKFGAFFQHLTLRVPNVLFDEDTFRTLMNLSSRIELKTLTLLLWLPSYVSFTEDDLGDTSLFSVLKAWHFSNLTDLRIGIPITHFQTWNNHLKVLYKKTYELLNSDAFRSVQKLKMLGSVTEQVISSQRSVYPTAVVVSRFSLLQELNITVINLSDHLLQVLADLSQTHHHFGLLTVMVISGCSVLPQLSSSAWQRLLLTCPHLQVNCRLSTTLTGSGIEKVIPPEVPLCRVVLDKKCRYHPTFQATLSMCRSHPKTLQSFLCFGDIGQKEDMTSLVTMVTNCTHVTELAIHGTIHIDDLTRLASLDRAWRRFEVRGERVVMGDRTAPCSAPYPAQHGPPVARAADPGKAGSSTVSDPEGKLSKVSDRLSACLGFKWKPL